MQRDGGGTGVWGKRDDMIVREQDPYNAEPTPAALADRALTPTDTFYSRNHGPIPEIDAATWRLQVSGMVRRPLELSLDGLQARFAHRTFVATLQCAGNRRAELLRVRDIPGEDPWGPCATSTARWTGVRLADVLDAAELDPRAEHVAFEAPDVSQLARPAQQYGASTPTHKALSPEVLLAWGMNGLPLSPAHGAPVRVVVPGYIGARSVKWVQRITAQAEPSGNYFQAVAYRLLPAEADPATGEPAAGPSLGPAPLNCAILRPEDGAVVAAGGTDVAGYAFAGEHGPVTRVEVSADGGDTWVEADVDPPDGAWAWQLWRARVHLASGAADVVARAVDSSGAVTPESAEQVWNPKGYVNTSCPRVAVTATG